MTGLRRSTAWTALALGIGLTGQGGCGSNVKVTPAEGVVKIDGKPTGGILVQFMPDSSKGGAGPSSFAVSDNEGKFQLKTYDGRQGAVVGLHQVTLVDNEEERPPQGKPVTKPPRVAPRYTIMGQISVEVKEGGSPIEINASAK